MKRRLSFFALFSLVFASFVAQADIRTEQPYYWYKFDASVNASSGSANLGNFGSGSGNNNALSPWGRALGTTGKGPYGSNFNLPDGDWTYHIRAQMPANLDRGVIWNVTTCGGANGLLLLTRAKDAGLTLIRTSAKQTLDAATAVDVDYAGLSKTYHNITAVYSKSAKTVQLYIDGVAAGSAFGYTAATGNQAWQWFSPHGNCNGTAIGVGVLIEEIRFYQRGLTIEEIATLGTYVEPGVTTYALTQDEDWRAGVPEERTERTIDLNGHTLTIANFTGLTVVADSSTGAPGTLALNNAGDVENTAVGLCGNLKFVKEGVGTFVANLKGQEYTGGTMIKTGTIASSTRDAAHDEQYHYFGAKDSSVQVEAGATLDTKGNYYWNHHALILAGGTLANTGADIGTSPSGIGPVELTADSFVQLDKNILLLDKEQSASKIDLGGHVLTVNGTAQKKLYVYSPFENGTVVMNTGVLVQQKAFDTPSVDYVFGLDADYEINNALTVRDLTWGGTTNGYWNWGTATTMVTRVFKPLNQNFHHTLLADGATLDLNGQDAPFDLTSAMHVRGSSTAYYAVTFAEGATITVDLSGRELKAGDQIVSWAAIPTGVTFRWDEETAKAGVGPLVAEGGLYYGEIGPTPAKDVLLTWPWQQNVYTNRFTIMCETSRIVKGLALQYGEGYAESVAMTYVEGKKSGTYVYKGIGNREQGIGAEGIGAEVPYRLAVDGVPLTYETPEECTEGVVKLWQDEDGDFTCSVWGDNQSGAKAGDWEADKTLYVQRLFEHMRARQVDFGISSGDFAAQCNYDTRLRPLILDRTHAILSRYVPTYVAWGNHDYPGSPDSGSGVITPRYFESGVVGDPTAYGTCAADQDEDGSGAYYRYRNNVLFVFVHWKSVHDTTKSAYGENDEAVKTWLENLLATDRAKKAKFRILVQHAPLWMETWPGHNTTFLLDVAKKGGIDLVLSGHTHSYERVEKEGIVQITNGGMGALDHGETCDTSCGSDIKVGGHVNTPYLWARQSEAGVLGGGNPVKMGCITSYGELSVKGNTLTYQAHGFNADGSYIGVFDTVSIASKTVVVDSPRSEAKAKNGGDYNSSVDWRQFMEKPVDHAAWKAYKDAIGETFEYSAGDDAKPVVNVSKTEIEKFLKWLNGTEGTYRLPTVSELVGAFGGDYRRDVTEWTMSVDEATGWRRILGGNAKASEGVWTSATDVPMIATDGCHANYLGFRLAEGAVPVEPTMEVVARWDFNDYDAAQPKSTNVLAATKGGAGRPCYYKGAGSTLITDGTIGEMSVVNTGLEAGNYALAIPKYSHVRLPLSDFVKGRTWKMTIRFFTPSESGGKFRCFFSRDNTKDGDLFLNKSNKIGGGDKLTPSGKYYTEVSTGAWHELVVAQGESSGSVAVDGTVAYGWNDTSKLDFFTGYDDLLLCADNSGEDELLYIDYVTLEGLVTPVRETATWTGAAGDNDIGNGANWSGGVAPVKFGAFTHDITFNADADWRGQAVPNADYATVDLGGRTLKLPNFNPLARAAIVDTTEGTKGTLSVEDGTVRILAAATIPAGITLRLGGTARLDLNGIVGTAFRLVMADGATLTNTGAGMGSGKVQIAGGLALEPKAVATVVNTAEIGLCAPGYADYPIALNGGTLVIATDGGNFTPSSAVVTGPGTIEVKGKKQFNVGDHGLTLADDVVLKVTKPGWLWAVGAATIPTIAGDGEVNCKSYVYTISKCLAGSLTLGTIGGNGGALYLGDGATLDLSMLDGAYTQFDKLTTTPAHAYIIDVTGRTLTSGEKLIGWTDAARLADVSLSLRGAKDFHLVRKADGLYVYSSSLLFIL